MDELLQRTAEAHDHLVPLHPEQQERLSAALLQLSHVSLASPEIGDGLAVSSPDVEHSLEQTVEHDRVNGMITEAARLTSHAFQELESRATETGEQVHADDESVFVRAKEIALGEAVLAKQEGRRDETEHALENMLVLDLLQPRNHSGSEVREVVAKGMAEELVAVVRGMSGVVAETQFRGTRDIPAIVRPQADLLRVATNTDFDDRFEHPTPLVRPGMPAQDAQRREELIDSLMPDELTALAINAADGKHNVGQASYLAIKALDGLQDPEKVYEVRDGKEVAKTLACAVDFAKASGDESKIRQTETAVTGLRAVRAAGTNYRVNNSLTHVLDEATVYLIADGRTDIASGLISSAPREISSPDSPPGSYNFDHAIEYLFDGTSAEKEAIRETIRQIHLEKINHFNGRLRDQGADETTIQAIRTRASDPESALDISNNFWAKYNDLMGLGQNDSYLASPKKGTYDIRNLIEGDGAWRLKEIATAVEQLLDAGLSAEQIGDGLVRSLDKLTNPKERETYLEEIVDVATLIRETQGEDYYKQAEILQAFSSFKSPRGALELVQRVYGKDSLESVNNLWYVSGDFSRQMVEIKPEDRAMLEYLASHENARALLADNDFVKQYVLPAGLEKVRTIFETIATHPELSELARLTGDGHVLERRLLATGMVEGVAVVVLAAYTKTGLRELLNDPIMSNLQTRIARYYVSVTSGNMHERAGNIVRSFDDTGLREILDSHPEYAQSILRSVEQFSFQPERAQALVEALSLSGVDELEGYLGRDIANKLVDEISGNKDPIYRAEQIIELYQSLDFLQEAHIKVDYSGHLDTWIEFLSSIPEGHAGETMKRQTIARLKLGIGEDAAQAVRIFGEVAVDPEKLDRLRAQGFSLIQQLYATEQMRGFPSAKPSKLGELFPDPEVGQIYKKLYDFKQAGDTTAMTALMDSYGFQPMTGEQTLTELVQTIKGEVAEVRKQEHAAKIWLNQFSGQPIKATKLIEAWKARELALTYDVKDNPTDILSFVAEKGVQIHADQAMAAGETDVTPEEFSAQSAVVVVMGSRYSPAVVFKAVERRIRFERQYGAYPPKLMVAAESEIEVDGTRFKAEILSADDPRGFTIGVDTGCCMTLGGVSENCIWAGFEDPRYSFFAVYDQAGRLRAQSIMYLAEEEGKKILVADNIEVNAGTDLAPIATVYRDALTKFAAEQKLDLDAIQIGEGFTAPDIIGQMPRALVAPPSPGIGVYTDARQQRVLWAKA